MSGTQNLSMYPTLRQPDPGGPAGSLGPIVGLVGAINQNTQFQQQQAYQQAIGPILANTVDPKTGQPDYNKAFLAVASNPATSRFAPQFFSDGIANQKIQADTALTGLQTQQKKFGAMLDAASSFLPYGNNVTQGQVQGRLAMMAANGQITQDEATNFAKNLAPNGQALADQIKTIALHAEGAHQALATVQGSPTFVNAGGTVKAFSPSAFTGQLNPMGDTAVTPTPGENNALVPTVDPVGNPSGTPRAQAAPMLTGGANPQVTNPGVGPARTGLNPLASQVLNTYVPALNARVSESATQLQTLNKMQDLLPKYVSGRGQDLRTEAAAWANSAGLPQELVGRIQGGGADGVAAAEEAQKLQLLNSISSLRSAIGTGQPISTNEVNTFRQVLPNITTNPTAMKNMMNYMQRLAAMPGIEQKGFNQFKSEIASGKRQGGIEDWPAYWNQQLTKSGVLGVSGALPDFTK